MLIYLIRKTNKNINKIKINNITIIAIVKPV